MRIRLISILLVASLGGCAWLTGSQKYSVYFQPYSANLDPQALETIHAAADFAKDHPLQVVRINGYSAPPDPGRDVEGLSDQRAENVRQALMTDGVPDQRIYTAGKGIVDPQVLPQVAVRRVDISVGE